jgi:DNA-binding response OmpR family regulator
VKNNVIVPLVEKLAATPIQDRTNSPRILVVDDEQDARQLTVDVLVQSGYNVDAVKDGAAGLAALQAGKYDLIVTDNKMPGMSGVEMIEKLRSARVGIPVVMVTGYLPAHDFVRRPWLKPDVTLEKPFSNNDLLAAVKKLLAAHDGISKSAQLFRDCAMQDNQVLQAKKPANAPIREPINPSHRILVVDDDKNVRQRSVDFLTGSGYEVEGVKDGAVGWEALQANNYDLVVTDNKMPNMTGIEMIAKLRFTRLPVSVIMATGNVPTTIIAHNPWLKPDAILQRPFSNDDLLATVRNVLGTRGRNEGVKVKLLPKK